MGPFDEWVSAQAYAERNCDHANWEVVKTLTQGEYAGNLTAIPASSSKSREAIEAEIACLKDAQSRVAGVSDQYYTTKIDTLEWVIGEGRHA